MGFLDRLRKSQSEGLDEWISLVSPEQLDEIDKLSESKPIAVFKHSTSCGISAGAKYRLESEWSSILEDLNLFYLDILSYRPISNAISERYGIRHESPQIVIIRNGKAIYHTSHHRINVAAIKTALSVN